jgi:hypothetical protein
MNLIEELDKLQQLHRSGALTDDEFAAAKAQVLRQGAPSPASAIGVAGHLHVITHQNELAQLDREWELARESYMVTGKHGHRYIPTQAGSVVVGVVIGLFGAFWTAMAAGITGGMAGHGPPGAGGLVSLFPLFGILFIVVGVGMSIYSFTRATEYAKAEQRYLQRRAELLARRPGPGEGTGKTDMSKWG